jgi:methionine-rich copper-binding protein CopC
MKKLRASLWFLGFVAPGLFIPYTLWAHAILVDSNPHDQAVVSERTFAVELAFNSRVDQSRSKVNLEGPKSNNTPVAIEKDSTHPSKLIAHVSDLTAGTYKLHWQVLAVDGHITRGVISFSVR